MIRGPRSRGKQRLIFGGRSGVGTTFNKSGELGVKILGGDKGSEPITFQGRKSGFNKRLKFGEIETRN